MFRGSANAVLLIAVEDHALDTKGCRRDQSSISRGNIIGGDVPNEFPRAQTRFCCTSSDLRGRNWFPIGLHDREAGRRYRREFVAVAGNERLEIRFRPVGYRVHLGRSRVRCECNLRPAKHRKTESHADYASKNGVLHDKKVTFFRMSRRECRRLENHMSRSR